MKNFLRLLARFAFMFFCFLLGANRTHDLLVTKTVFGWLVFISVVFMLLGIATAFFPSGKKKITK